MILDVAVIALGLQNARAMWAEKFTGFLFNFDFAQSITDRRMFHLTDENGLVLIAGTARPSTTLRWWCSWRPRRLSSARP